MPSLHQQHLLIDARCASAGHSGVARALLNHLAGIHGILAHGGLGALRVTVLRNLLTGGGARWSRFGRFHFVDVGPTPEDHPHGDLWLQRRLPKLLEEIDATVLFSPAFTGPAGACPCRRVLMVHDDLVWSQPDSYPLKFRLWLGTMATRSAQAADAVVFPSAAARDACLSHLEIDRAKSAVVPNSADLDLFHPEPTDRPTRPAEVLYVASALPRKNHAVLLAAVNGSTEVCLRLAGLGAEREAMLERARAAAPLARVELLEDSSDEALAVHYRTASVYAHPATGEGFGLPVIEAMACGTPLLLADIAVLREVAGDAALYADPRDPEAWRRGLAEILSNPAATQKRAAAGVARAREFSLEAGARKLLEVLLTADRDRAGDSF